MKKNLFLVIAAFCFSLITSFIADTEHFWLDVLIETGILTVLLVGAVIIYRKIEKEEEKEEKEK